MSRYSVVMDKQQSALRWIASEEGQQDFFGGQTRRIVHVDGTETLGDSLEQDETKSANRLLYNHLVTLLVGGEPFYWSPELSSLLTQVSADMPPWTLRREAIITPHGYMWFDQPLPLPDGSQIEAIGWGMRGRDAPGQRVQIIACLWLVGWQGQPAMSFVWDTGTTQPNDTAERRDVLTQAVYNRMIVYVAAAFALFEQRILVAPRVRPDRATLRRMTKAGRKERDLFVVTLRRAAHQADTGEGEPVEWSCRWIVRGHWKQQPYGPGNTLRKPIFILPHVKGPDGLPLKPLKQRLFAVTR